MQMCRRASRIAHRASRGIVGRGQLGDANWATPIGRRQLGDADWATANWAMGQFGDGMPRR